jgi:L-threonylcarbamoyladenylate synthase
MTIMTIDDVYNEKLIERIVASLMSNKIVIMPSDTIYGFLFKEERSSSVREIKKRDRKPFILLISSFKMLDKLGVDYNYHFLSKYWPGPYTFILKDNTSDYKIGVRFPNFRALNEIIRRVGTPLCSTSVNFSGEPAINDPEIIIREFDDKVDLIVRDYNYKPSQESVVYDCVKKCVIRGGVDSIRFDIS